MAFNLTIQSVPNTQTGASQGNPDNATDPYCVQINENVEAGTMIGKIVGWEASWPTTGQLTFSVRGDDRYEIIGNRTNGFFLVVKNGGPDLFNYEDPEGPLHGQVTVDVYDSNDPSETVHEGVYDIYLKDIENEGPANTPPVIGGVAAEQNVQDIGAAAVSPFGTLTITDGTTTPTFEATVTFTGGAGTLTHLQGVGSLSGNTYTVRGTRAEVEAALKALSFNPNDNPNGAVNTVINTTFTLSITDGSMSAEPVSTIVHSTVANRAPVLTASARTINIAETETTDPFSQVSITDTNAGDTVTVTIILDDRNKGAFTDAQALGFTVNAQGHYVLTGVSAATAQDRIRQLTFDPRDRQGQTGTETTSFTITVRDANGGQATASTNQINVVSTHAYVNQAPSISVAPGKETTNATYEGGSVRPFTGVDIGDLENDSLTLEISFAEVDGRLENTDGVNGEIRDGTITYTFSNRSADALDQLIRNIWFNPANKPGTNSFTTSFTIKVDDPSHDPVENRQVKVITSTTNATPSITVPVGKETTVATDDGLNVNPFKDVAIADQDGDRISLQIAFDADDGRLEETDGVQGVVEAGTITYTFTNYTLDAIRLLMSQLEFNPTNRNDTPGTIYQTQFKISVKDAVHDYVSNSQIRVVTTITEKDPTNDAPTVRVATGQISHIATDVGQTAKPFTGVILDDDEDDELTVTISFAAADGALEKYGDAEWSVQNGVITYEFSGKAGDIEAQLDLVEFNPRDRPDTLTSSTHKTSFTIKVNDQAHASSTPATNNSIEVITNITPKNTGPSRITLSGDSVAELAADNFKVGTFGAVDANPGDTFTYSMVPGSDADGRFKIVNVGGTWELHVVSGVRLDNEQASSHNIKVMVVDRSGASFIQDFTIKVNDLNPETMTVASASSLNDIIKGSKAGNFKDVFYGGAGDDKLWGGYGNDILSGGVGKDVFVFDGKLGTSKTDRQVNFDTIMDYSVKEDSIWLEGDLFKSNKKLFAAIKKGTENKPLKMASKFFTVGDKAKDADDYFVYDAKKRVLYYDADGSGSKAAIEMASFTNNKALKNFKHTEFFFI